MLVELASALILYSIRAKRSHIQDHAHVVLKKEKKYYAACIDIRQRLK
jgi:hypothetical protein